MSLFIDTTFDDAVDLADLLEFAKKYNALGWAIQEQLHDLAEGRSGDINPNALAEIEEKLGGYHSELDTSIEEAKDGN